MYFKNQAPAFFSQADKSAFLCYNYYENVNKLRWLCY